MESDTTVSRSHISRRGLLAVGSAIVLAGCTLPASSGGSSKDEGEEPVLVLVELVESGDVGAAQARVLDALDPSVAETARVYDRLPLIALRANADALLVLLRHPDVSAVRADSEVRPSETSG